MIYKIVHVNIIEEVTALLVTGCYWQYAGDRLVTIDLIYIVANRPRCFSFDEDRRRFSKSHFIKYVDLISYNLDYFK